MLTAILAFFQAVPAIAGGINNFTNKYYDAKVQITTARIGGDRDVAKQLVTGVVSEGQTRVEFLKTVGQSKFLMVLIGGFATPYMIYEWQCIVYDKIWMNGTHATDPITGNLADWGGVIIGSIFGSATVLGVGQMYFNRRER